MKNAPYKILLGILTFTICIVVGVTCGFGKTFNVKLNSVQLSAQELKASGEKESVTAQELDKKSLPEMTDKALQGIYRKFIAENCPNCLVHCFADVTRDGIDELILINGNEDSTVTGYVYSYADDKVILLEEKDAQNAADFGWYLRRGENGCTLVEETFGKKVSLNEYALCLDGMRIDVDEYTFDYNEKNKAAIKENFSFVLRDCMKIFATVTCSDGSCLPLDKGIIK